MLVFVRASRYDAGTGQFTQQDPIGIAGGANVYGFVSGDPVNFADPFGLWPDPLKLAAGTTKFMASGIGQVLLAALCSMGCVEHARGDLQVTGVSLPLPVGRLIPGGPGMTTGSPAGTALSTGTIWRSGKANPSNLTPREGESSVSMRSSLRSGFAFSDSETACAM